MTYSEFLIACKIENNVLYVNDNYIDYNEIANKLRCDILDNKVPHMRVVGLNVGNISNELNFIDKLDIINKSYLDLMCSMKDVVFIEPHGFKSDERVSDALRSYFKSDDFEGGIAVMGDHSVTTGDAGIFYNQTQISARFLINGIPIIKNADKPYAVYMLYLSGTGYLPASKMSRVLRHCRYKPITTEFSLSNYVLVDARPNNAGVRLHFKRDLDVDGFMSILHAYGNKLEGM